MSCQTPSSLNTWTSEYLVSYHIDNNDSNHVMKSSILEQEAQHPEEIPSPTLGSSSNDPPKLLLDSSSSAKWSRDEELRLIGFYLAFGVDWDRASQYILGRTPSVIKCKFNNMRRHSAVVTRKRQDDIGLFMQRFSTEVEKASMTLGSFHTEYVLTGKFPVTEEAIKKARDKAILDYSNKEKPKEKPKETEVRRTHVLKRYNTLVRLTRIEHRVRMTREIPTPSSLDSLQEVCHAGCDEDSLIFRDIWPACRCEQTPSKLGSMTTLNPLAH